MAPDANIKTADGDHTELDVEPERKYSCCPEIAAKEATAEEEAAILVVCECRNVVTFSALNPLEHCARPRTARRDACPRLIMVALVLLPPL